MKIKPIILLLIVITIVMSCEKIIEVDQPDIIEQDQAFSDQNSTRLSVIGIYGLIADLVEPMFLAGEVRADLAVANKSANTYIKEFSNNTFSASNPYISPRPFYTVINNANDFINVFEEKLAKAEMDSATFRKYKSELVAIRVWTQYQILKIFGKCQYYTEDQDMNSLTGITEYSYEDTTVIRHMINDLTYSDTSTHSATTDGIIWITVRISDFYVNVLMAELYMEMGMYEEAIEKFDEVTSRGDINNQIDDYDLYDIRDRDKLLTRQLWYYELFDEDWETAGLFYNAPFMIAFDNKYNQSNELWNWTASLNYQIAPADSFVNKFLDHSFNIENEFIDYRYYSILNHDELIDREYAISKYPGDDRPFIMTRTARIEILKSYCEILNDEERSAFRTFNKVRARIEFDEIDDDQIPEDADPVVWFEDKVIDELAYETCFEGQRWFDLMMIAKRRNDPAYLADKIAKKYPIESREEIRNYLMNPKNWYIPILE